MKIIDLSHPFAAGMPVFPGALEVSVEVLSDVVRHGYHVKKLAFNSHTGTHVDAPFHMLADGSSLDQLAAEHFFGKARVIPVKLPAGARIDVADLLPYKELLPELDFVLFYTGWQDLWSTPDYLRGFPCLSVETVEWLAEFSLKGIGLDTISVDPMDAVHYSIHYSLFGRNMVIVENLTNLDLLGDEVFYFSAMPLNIVEGDGCPVRAVAIFADPADNPTQIGFQMQG